MNVQPIEARGGARATTSVTLVAPPKNGTAASALPPGTEGLSLTDRVYLAIKDDIANVRLQPGETIIEPVLAERFGVSKTPVREALRLLAHEDLVLILPRKGYVVRPLGFEDVVEIFALRAVLQPPVFAEAARRRLPHQVMQLRELWSRFEAADDRASEVVIGQQFNMSVTEMAGPTRAARILHGLFLESQRFWLLSRHVPGPDGWQKADDLSYYERLLDTLERGDADAAGQVAAEYVGVLQSRVLGSMGLHI